MISRWQKCRPIAIDGEIARIDLVSESRNVQQMISWVQRFWNSHEPNSGILSGEIGQAITAMQSPAQLSQKRRYGRGFHAVSAHLMNISENVEESFSFRGCFLEAGFFFWRNKRTIFPQGLFPKYPFSGANKGSSTNEVRGGGRLFKPRMDANSRE
jgi:hypothetical protein